MGVENGGVSTCCERLWYLQVTFLSLTGRPSPWHRSILAWLGDNKVEMWLQREGDERKRGWACTGGGSENDSKCSSQRAFASDKRRNTWRNLPHKQRYSGILVRSSCSEKRWGMCFNIWHFDDTLCLTHLLQQHYSSVVGLNWVGIGDQRSRSLHMYQDFLKDTICHKLLDRFYYIDRLWMN